ncbi:MAG: hypothetical protein H0V96_11335 [Acidimicrobiia bacterium]|nr:hypothetical protein [Acidimicrobiia bacterium]
MSRRRPLSLLTATVLVAGLIAGPVGAARADEELDRYLAAAGAAAYSGTQVVVTTWNGGTFATVVDIERSGSGTVVTADNGSVTVIDDGSAHDAAGTVRISAWSTHGTTDGYQVTAVREVTTIGRPALEVVVSEGSMRRALLVIDEETRAALATTVFNPDGSVFREITSTEFGRPDTDRADVDAGPGYTMMVQAPDSDLPGDLAGYRLTDGYQDGDGVSQAYFSDGLFSFSVFQLDAPARLDRLEDAVVHELDGHAYRVVVEPSALLVTWEADGASYVLVGDLPPDHLDAVLRQLPTPGSTGLLGRIWQGLFG